METLILGNGISRLSYDDTIRSWDGEVWGCNRSYLEYGDILARLTGHREVLIEAREYREKNQVSFELWGGHLANIAEADKAFTCPRFFCKDSGTTMVAQALHEGRDVAVCGFDLGGPDIHSPGIENTNKHGWIKRWMKLFEYYGRDRVRFIGYDHLPFILNRRDIDAYSKNYMAGMPHIYEVEYLKQWEKWSGRPAYQGDVKEIEMKVKYPNGRISEMKGPIALKMIAKGKVEAAEKEKKPAEKPAAKKPAPAKADK